MTGTNLIVFRDRAEQRRGPELLHSLQHAIDHLSGCSRENILEALLLAGEFECVLEDNHSPARRSAAAITDGLADLLMGAREIALAEIANHVKTIAEQPVPEMVHISPPEGFSYYALHPEDFAEACGELADGRSVAVIGIRSIGTTLSAVAAAAFRQRGVPVARITVRPTEHPYDRAVHLRASETAWVEQQRESGSTFLVVDEGPGLSGSSFLATAEALVDAGVASANIILMGTREADPCKLCAPNAAERWRRFRWKKVRSTILRRFSQFTNVSGGEWRRELFGTGTAWPASWPEMERLKFLSPDRRFLFKFDGLGRFGSEVRHRAEVLYRAGYIPSLEGSRDGMTAYRFVPGKPLTDSDLSRPFLETMAEYCAFRRSEFPCAENMNGSLDQMLRFNFSQEFGRDPKGSERILQPTSATIVDGRMQPHEWIAGDRGEIFKIDACTHGDDHFFPGPTDIAWDLAGIIVEWRLPPDAREFLLSAFHKRSGVDMTERIDAFTLAYTVFRLAFYKMALGGTQVEAEKPRLRSAYDYYRRSAWELFQKLGAKCA